MGAIIQSYGVQTSGGTHAGGVGTKAFLLTVGHVTSMLGPTAATYGGVAMTQQYRSIGKTCYYLDGPPNGPQVVSWSGGDGHMSRGWIITTTGVRGGGGSSSAEADLSINVTIEAVGDLVLCTGYGEQADAGITLSLSSVTGYIGATLEDRPSYSQLSRAGWFLPSSVGSLTEAWTPPYGTDSSAVHVFRLAGGGNQVIMIAFRRWQNFLRNLRLGLVPPDMLRRTYRDLVTI